MKILVFGANGQVGLCLQDCSQFTNGHEFFFYEKSKCDIANISNLYNTINLIDPDLIINLAAYTNVDKAEDQKDLAEKINSFAVGNLSKICKEKEILLMHFSTDYIFEGSEGTPYVENSSQNPINFYGITKQRGEMALKESGCKYILIRTSWVFSEYGKNFLKTMLSIAQKKDEISVVNDEIGAPTNAHDIAFMIINIIDSIDASDNIKETFHFAGDRPCSWYEFAMKIFYYANEAGFKTPNKIIQIKSSEFNSRAKRPKFSFLNSEKIKQKFNIKPSNWESAIKKTLNNLNSSIN